MIEKEVRVAAEPKQKDELSKLVGIEAKNSKYQRQYHEVEKYI